MKALLKMRDGSSKDTDLIADKLGDVVTVKVGDLDYKNTQYIDFAYDYSVAKEGDNGYMVIAQGRNCDDNMICEFNGHKDTEYIGKENLLPIYGFKNGDICFVAIVTGMTYEYSLVAGVNSGKYYIFPRFQINYKMPYEEISVEYHYLYEENADYSGMAREYRNYLLNSGICVPIKNRMNEYLDYAKDSIYIRIRQAWKPVPSPISQQTAETEPKMHMACDFKRVGRLMEECKKKGIDKIEFCLVGWNIKGHDGRWPQPFPVEPELGGEEELRKLITKANNLGYKIVCHSNSTDAYSISDMWDENILSVNQDLEYIKYKELWSGGQAYEICPQKSYELAKEILPKIAELGFKGLHYIDVLGVVPLRECYSDRHPVNRRQASEYNKKIAKLSTELFGGFSSEGAYAHIAGDIDFGLYISFHNYEDSDSLPDIADKNIPLWQLVFHGIILSNPYATTINAPIKSKNAMLKLIERGGRPSIYYYSKFVTADNKSNMTNWMGNEDFVCDTDDQMVFTVDKLKNLYNEYSKLSYLQTEFMEKHEEIARNIYQVTYSDNTKIIIDYNTQSYKIIK